MIIYLDNNFICHLNNDGEEFLEYEIDDFNNKCETYIEGYRVIPEGYTWTRSDGVTFNGLMITPAETYNHLQSAQKQYEIDQNKMQDLNDVKEIIDLLYTEDIQNV